MREKQVIDPESCRKIVAKWPEASVSGYKSFKKEALEICDQPGNFAKVQAAHAAFDAIRTACSYEVNNIYTARPGDIRGARVFLEGALFQVPIYGYFGLIHFAMAVDDGYDRLVFKDGDVLGRVSRKKIEKAFSKTEDYQHILQAAYPYLLEMNPLVRRDLLNKKPV